MKRNHKAKKDIDTRIHRMCMMAGTDEYQMEELGSTLLEVFHDVCRYNTEAANDMMEISVIIRTSALRRRMR